MKNKFLRLIMILSIIACATLALVGCNGPALPSPLSLKVDAAVTVLSWKSVAGARGYQIEIKKEGESRAEIVDVKRSSYGISNLESRCNYTFRVKAVGDKVNNSDSDWSEKLEIYKPFENGMTFRSINGSTEYEVSSIGSATRNTTEVEIPSTYRGKPVTKIGNSAFYNNSRITKMIIPDSIVEIGEAAFRNCVSLLEIEIPDSVTVIGKGAFQGCSVLKTAKISNNLVEMPANMFYGCSKLLNFEGGESIEVIGASAFFNCKDFGIATKTFDDPEDDSHFTATYYTVELPAKLKVIGETAFSKCSGINKIVISDEVVTISTSAFRECVNLESVEFNDKVETIGASAFATCPRIVSMEIPDSVTEIGDNAFAGCKMLSEIQLSSNLAILGRGVFEDTVFWNSAEEGDLVYVENWLVGTKFPQVDNDPVGPANVVIADGTVGIAAHAMHCTVMPDDKNDPVGSALETVVIPASVRSIGVAAFQDSLLLTSVTIGTSKTAMDSELTLIEENAFVNCLYLDTFNYYGEKLHTIGNQAFASCSRLGKEPSNDNAVKEIYLPASLRVIGTRAFYETYFWEHYKGVVYAGGWVVGFNSTDATQATIDSTKNGVTTVGISNYAFYKLESLTTVTIANTVKYIGKSAFYKSPALTKIEIPEGVEKIEDYTFYNCVALKDIKISSTVKEIGDYAFFNAGSEENDTTVATLRGMENVEKIGTYAFYNNAYVKEVAFGDSLTTMGARAFFGTALSSLEIPGSLTEIPAYAFANISTLTSVTIKEGVETIGRYAFSNDTAIESIVLPSTVVTIGEYAFRNNTALSELKLNDGLETISKSAFVNCTSLTNIEIPSSVKTIGNMAFRSCTGLTGVILKDTIVDMGMHIFYGTKVTFYTSMTAIPATWSIRWNSANRPIIFGCTIANDAETGNSYVEKIVVGKNTFSIYSTNKPKDDATEIKDPIVGPARDGYTFLGWATSADGEVVFEAQYIFDAPEGETLYAVWQADAVEEPETPEAPEAPEAPEGSEGSEE